MQTLITEAQRIEAILHLEGMPAELTLDVDRAEAMNLQDDDTDAPTDHDRVIQALNLDNATPVDTFIAAQAEHEYRWQDDNKDVI